MNRHDLIFKYRDLFWYHSKDQLDQISDSVLVEFILNYGDLQAVKDLINCLGLEHVGDVFYKSLKRDRHNYLDQVANFFNHYFARHVHRDTVGHTAKTA